MRLWWWKLWNGCSDCVIDHIRAGRVKQKLLGFCFTIILSLTIDVFYHFLFFLKSKHHIMSNFTVYVAYLYHSIIDTK